MLQDMEGFTFATSLDLNMGYYTIRLDPDAQKICTIVLPWGKYLYMHLPIDIAGSLDIFQEKMLSLMESLEFVHKYLDDLLTLTKGTYDDNLSKWSSYVPFANVSRSFRYIHTNSRDSIRPDNFS